MIFGDFIEQQRELDWIISKFVKVNVLGCWEWIGTRKIPGPHGGPYGYATMKRPDGVRRQCLAHRLVYWACYGEDPGTLLVRHKCDNPVCVNPYHLELGTHADNNADAISRKRHHALNPGGKYVKERAPVVREILDMYYSLGMGVKEISDIVECSTQRVEDIVYGPTWPDVFREWCTSSGINVQRRRPGTACGNKNGLSKLNPESAIAIRKNLATGVSMSEMARQFGVSVPTVAAVKKGETWKHV